MFAFLINILVQGGNRSPPFLNFRQNYKGQGEKPRILSTKKEKCDIIRMKKISGNNACGQRFRARGILFIQTKR